jgi:hypothetical protein
MPPAFALSFVPSWYSPSYGVRVPCAGIALDVTERIPFRCEFRLS